MSVAWKKYFHLFKEILGVHIVLVMKALINKFKLVNNTVAIKGKICNSILIQMLVVTRVYKWKGLLRHTGAVCQNLAFVLQFIDRKRSLLPGFLVWFEFPIFWGIVPKKTQSEIVRGNSNILVKHVTSSKHKSRNK